MCRDADRVGGIERPAGQDIVVEGRGGEAVEELALGEKADHRGVVGAERGGGEAEFEAGPGAGGGEIAALVVIDAVARLVPGVLGCAQSAEEESFAHGLLEYPQYTRPPDFRGAKVPNVLLSGHHAAVARWRPQPASGKVGPSDRELGCENG